MQADIRVAAGFPEAQRPVAARLFWAAFSGKLGRILAPEDKALRLIARLLDPRFAVSATDGDGTLLGLAGYKTRDGALIGGGLPDMASIYGPFGGLWRGVLLDLLDRAVEPGCLLMDGIFVAGSARGKGIGSALLEAICEEARTRDLSRVRLDVIDTNPRARTLYERSGFKAVDTQKTGLLKPLFGFASATRMERQVPSHSSQ
ncbi:GNAT family N-acetyltransferase [Roseibium sp. AS2]|uniref:GNAT family N-acetyltransferase n=1 Tax=Roseibium sp. AS2 TaxID=3135781 RepID=UPI0031751EDE